MANKDVLDSVRPGHDTNDMKLRVKTVLGMAGMYMLSFGLCGNTRVFFCCSCTMSKLFFYSFTQQEVSKGGKQEIRRAYT